MQTLERLYLLAGTIDEAWCDREAVHWSEAEQLVACIGEIENLATLPGLEGIMAYASIHTEWDSGIVASWPRIIIDSLSGSDKEYRYRPDGETWEVYSVTLSNEEDWVGDVDTERVAGVLVAAMNAIESGRGLS